MRRARPGKFLPRLESGESNFVGDLLRKETVGGSVALIAAVVALIWANINLDSYVSLREAHLGPFTLETWAADGALSVFFFLAGLELKRELLVGSLKNISDAIVPVAAATCGVIVPALIYAAINLGSDTIKGWAIPAATDIAFALAILAVVGSALPSQLRAFLLTLAVVDDLIVIIIIAVVYTETIHFEGLAIAIAGFAAFGLLQRLRVTSIWLYLPIAVISWAALHESGVHATIAGVIMGLLVRVIPDKDETDSPAERLEHRIVPISSGICVPFFAFMSAGVALKAGADLFASPVLWGVVAGLVIGKPIGVLGGSWLITRFTRADLNEDVSWRDLIGVAVLAGVGFTVSLLVSNLSFTGQTLGEAKAAVLIGSLASGLVAAVILGRRNRFHRTTEGTTIPAG
ncbi:MAG TPA: Na+/H+ antiporter NhaA [Marmoricola sp.]|nr:Na+/H+ antiporter NhaA [Nocardioidaceae bacterium]HRV68770.1 Na+/H+ antiporter NhaA [Marmoricola sp.]